MTLKPFALAVLAASFVGCGSEEPGPPLVSSGGAPGATATAGTGAGTGTPSASAGSGQGSGTRGGGGGPAECQQVTLQADQATPDVLIVLDRSTSMIQNDSFTDRWSGSVNAINTVVSELERVIRFGLMTFPGGDPGGLASGAVGVLTGAPDAGFDLTALGDLLGGAGGGANGLVCATGQLDVPFSIMNAQAIQQSLGGMLPVGLTPTAGTLQEARRVLAEAPMQMHGEFVAPKYVLLLTDGDPNCSDTNTQSADPAAQQASIQAVRDLYSDGTVTYVIGFQTGGTSFAPVLDQMAAEGGSGDTAHRSVQSGDELLEEFRKIAGSSRTCTFVLAQQVSEDRVDIRVDGEPAEYGTDWDLRDDGQTIDLLGRACDALRTGALVQADVSCEPVRLI